MKLIAITLLAVVAAVYAAPSGPIQISDNNVGDIVTVGINANAVLSNHQEQNIAVLLALLLNQQALVIGGNEINVAEAEAAKAEAQVAPQVAPQVQITPEMIEKVKNFISKQ